MADSRKRKLEIDLFNVDEVNKVASCKICGKVVKCLRNFTYVRHYVSQHKEFAKENGLLLTDYDDGTIGEDAAEFSRTRIGVRMNRQVYVKAMVETVTVVGAPLKLLNCAPLRRIFDPIEKGLNEKPGEATQRIDSRSIKPIVGTTAEKLRRKIMEEVRGRLICLKLDTATRLGRDVLCVNIQFIDKNVIKIRTLAMVELKHRHTAEHLEKVVLNILTSYKIDVSQIYSCTTDNGSNMLATNKRFFKQQEMQEMAIFGLIDDNDADDLDEANESNDDSDDDSDEEIADVQKVEGDDFDSNAERERILLEKITPIFSGVRCAAHTAQLAVSDTIKGAKLRNHLNAIQAFVKKLRKIPYKNLFKLNNIETPKLSCDTRWNSWYDSASSVKSNKEFICSITKNDKEVALTNETWTFIDNFIDGFEPVAQLTTVLQSSQLTIGDFYLAWLRCKLLLGKKENPLSKQLLANMEARESALTSNKAFLAAIYLDQRINYRNSPLFSEDQRQAALEHLKNIWRSIQRVSQGGSSNVSTDDPVEGHSANYDDVLEEFFRSHEVSQDLSISTSLFDQLEDLSRSPRLKLEKGQSILDYWNGQKQAKQDLYCLAVVALATPATQVSTERAFSTLAFILTKLRTRLGETTLANILIIRLNAELFQQITV